MQLVDIRQEDYVSLRIKAEIERAIRPFPVQEIRVWLVEDFLEASQKVQIKMAPLTEYPFEMTIPARYYSFHPYEVAAIVCGRAAEHYAAVHVPVDDHIHLGED